MRKQFSVTTVRVGQVETNVSNINSYSTGIECIYKTVYGLSFQYKKYHTVAVPDVTLKKFIRCQNDIYALLGDFNLVISYQSGVRSANKQLNRLFKIFKTLFLK